MRVVLLGLIGVASSATAMPIPDLLRLAPLGQFTSERSVEDLETCLRGTLWNRKDWDFRTLDNGTAWIPTAPKSPFDNLFATDPPFVFVLKSEGDARTATIHAKKLNRKALAKFQGCATAAQPASSDPQRTRQR